MLVLRLRGDENQIGIVHNITGKDGSGKGKMPQDSGAESEVPRISGLAQQQLSTLIRAAPCTVDASTGHGATDGPRGKTLAINEIRWREASA